MAVTHLDLYNDALFILGERELATIDEDVEPRHVLDQAWTKARDYCLQQGHWKFALRSSKFDFTPSVTPAFGYSRAIEKPSDYIRTSRVCSDEFFNSPYSQYTEEQGFWYSELDSLYIQYVSNDTNYGYDYSAWPETFSYFVAAYLAFRIRRRIMPSLEAREIAQELATAKDNALSKDAVEGPTQQLPVGKWVNARHGGRRKSYYDRTTRGV